MPLQQLLRASTLRKRGLDGLEAVRVGKYNLGFATSATSVWMYRISDVLIDTGPPNQWAIVDDYIAKHPIRRIFLTHHHEDHSGNAQNLAQKYGAKIYAPEASLTCIERGFHLERYRQFFWGTPPRIQSPQAFPSSEKVTLDAIHATLVPIATPGHSFDHHVFHIPERGWLFSGDLYLTSRPELSTESQNAVLEIQSLRHVLETLAFDTVFCAHRGPLEKDGRARICARLDHLEFIQDQVERLAEARPDWTLDRVTRELDRQGQNKTIEHFFFQWGTGWNFSRQNLIRPMMMKKKRRSD